MTSDIGLPGAKHFIEPVAGEIAHELLQPLRREPGSEHLARHVADAETGQCSVTIEGDETGTKSGHEFPPCSVFRLFQNKPRPQHDMLQEGLKRHSTRVDPPDSIIGRRCRR